MKSMKLPLTDAQLRKLAKGQGVRVNPSSGCTAYDIYCDPAKCKRMERMMTKGKGFTLKLSPEEMQENVEIEGGRINFKKIGRTLRSTAKSVGKFYREKIRPTVGPKIRKVVSEAIEKGIPLAAEAIGAVTGQPEIVALAETPQIKKLAKKVSKAGTEKLSKLTGAFGMAKAEQGGALKMDKSLAKQIYKMEHTPPLPYKAQLQDNYSPFLNPNHPGMNPTLPMADNSLPLVGRGLYMQTGRGLYAGSGLYMGKGVGSPMDPALPQVDNSTYIM